MRGRRRGAREAEQGPHARHGALDRALAEGVAEVAKEARLTEEGALEQRHGRARRGVQEEHGPAPVRFRHLVFGRLAQPARRQQQAGPREREQQRDEERPPGALPGEECEQAESHEGRQLNDEEQRPARQLAKGAHEE